MPAPKDLLKEEEAKIRTSRGKLPIGQARKKFGIVAQLLKVGMPDDDFPYAEEKDDAIEMVNALEKEDSLLGLENALAICNRRDCGTDYQ